MAVASYFRVKGEQSDLPLMLWPDSEGNFIVQVGRRQPFTSITERVRFADIVTDMMWMASPITRAEYDHAMETGAWPDATSSKETA